MCSTSDDDSDSVSSDESLEINSDIGLEQDVARSKSPIITEIISDDAAAEASFQQHLHGSPDSSPESENDALGNSRSAVVSPRAYQVEMLDASLKQNAIIVVSTDGICFL